jgi:hypothetical protein
MLLFEAQTYAKNPDHRFLISGLLMSVTETNYLINCGVGLNSVTSVNTHKYILLMYQKNV